MVVIGDKDVEASAVSVRSRKAGDMGSMSVDDFVDMIVSEVETKKR